MDDSLAELEEAHREVLLLRHYAGASWERTAELMGHPSPDAARMLHARALNALRKSLRRRGVHDFTSLP
jgi:DNA-directed RNA polymerase specialized sigma24 family protein